jgi:hypothetical protein
MNNIVMVVQEDNRFTTKRLGMPDVTIEKVPEHIYQTMYDMCFRLEEEERKPALLKFLKEYYANVRPGKVIVNMIDLSRDEVNAIKDRYPMFEGLTWGMYVVFDTGSYENIDLQQLLSL